MTDQINEAAEQAREERMEQLRKEREQKIKAGMDALFSGFQKMAAKESAESYAQFEKTEFMQELISHAEKNDFEQFYFQGMHQINKPIEGALDTLGHDDQWKFLMMNGYQVYNIFTGYFLRTEGSAFSADKGRFLVRGLLKFFISGEEIGISGKDESYWEPRFSLTSHNAIMGFYESIRVMLSSGNVMELALSFATSADISRKNREAYQAAAVDRVMAAAEKVE